MGDHKPRRATLILMVALRMIARAAATVAAFSSVLHNIRKREKQPDFPVPSLVYPRGRARVGVKQAGFTLIEVLVAVVILGVALVAVTRSLSLGVRDAQRIQDKNIAHWVALNVINRAKLGVILTPDSGGAIQSGQEVMLGQTWIWKMQAQNVTDLPMRQLNVQVFNSKQQSMETIQTYVYIPPVAPYGMSLYAR